MTAEARGGLPEINQFFDATLSAVATIALATPVDKLSAISRALVQEYMTGRTVANDSCSAFNQFAARTSDQTALAHLFYLHTNTYGCDTLNNHPDMVNLFGGDFLSR